MTNRRTFLRQGAGALAGAATLPSTRPSLRSLSGSSGPHRRALTTPDPTLRVNTDPAVKGLALRAIDAAKAAGATFADVRLTRTLTRAHATPSLSPIDAEEYAVGVRALVGGAWGFAASPYWTPEEVTTLAATAVAQAKANALATTRPVELAPAPVTTGTWVMPVKIDPFTIPLEEMVDFARDWEARVWGLGRDTGRYVVPTGGFPAPWCRRQEQAVATTEGSYFTQTTWRTYYAFSVRWKRLFVPAPAPAHLPDQQVIVLPAAGLGLQAAGWEMLLDADLEAQFAGLLADAEREANTPRPPVTPKYADVGRYDMVFDVKPVLSLLETTFGSATQLDRALGYEANASGTSYVTDPLDMVGSLQIASPLVTVTADRSTPKSLAWTKWDAEGVEPENVTLVKDGVLVDYQTTRETASCLREYYAKAGKPVRSHGHAALDTALDVPLAQTPNLTLKPGKEDVSFDDLVRDTKRGVAVIAEEFTTDFQGLSGLGTSKYPSFREIVNGKLGAPIMNLRPQFNALELWKSVQAIGGPASTGVNVMQTRKGQPEQGAWHNVRAVPVKFTGVAFVDPSRRG